MANANLGGVRIVSSSATPVSARSRIQAWVGSGAAATAYLAFAVVALASMQSGCMVIRERPSPARSTANGQHAQQD
jgi:hypothetical protein